MVRPLAPFKQICRHCAWCGPAILHHSDAIDLSPLLEKIRPIKTIYPQCGSTNVATEPITGLPLLLAKVFGGH